jgi:HAD domain in Swiss Army Knife RNA repair proteins
MKILFLDCDGVLNSKQHFMMCEGLPPVPGADTLSDADLFHMKRNVNPNNMWALGYVLGKLPDLKVVVSSSWRNHYALESFRDLFKIFGLDGERIIGKTPQKFSSERAHEIREWLSNNIAVTVAEGGLVRGEWLAVDDHVIFDLGDQDKANELLTDGWVGFTMNDAFRAIRHFKADFKEPGFYI